MTAIDSLVVTKQKSLSPEPRGVVMPSSRMTLRTPPTPLLFIQYSLSGAHHLCSSRFAYANPTVGNRWRSE